MTTQTSCHLILFFQVVLNVHLWWPGNPDGGHKTNDNIWTCFYCSCNNITDVNITYAIVEFTFWYKHRTDSSVVHYFKIVACITFHLTIFLFESFIMSTITILFLPFGNGQQAAYLCYCYVYSCYQFNGLGLQACYLYSSLNFFMVTKSKKMR